MPAADNTVTVDLKNALPLQTVNTSAHIRDNGRDLKLLLVHEDQGRYHAFSARCTHGGSPVGYDADRHLVQLLRRSRWKAALSRYSYDRRAAHPRDARMRRERS